MWWFLAVSKILGDNFWWFLGTGGRAGTRHICGTTAAGVKGRAARAAKVHHIFSLTYCRCSTIWACVANSTFCMSDLVANTSLSLADASGAQCIWVRKETSSPLCSICNTSSEKSIIVKHPIWRRGDGFSVHETAGGYDKEEKAARAFDLAALKYWGPSTTTNFPVST